MGYLWAQIVLTLVTLGYSLVPARADLNRTHATNPLWTGHARYHVVWQVGSYVGVALVALFLIWAPGPFALARLLLAACLAGAAYGGFFVALASMPRYAGRLADENGVPPLVLGGLRVDLNVGVFLVVAAVLVATVVVLLVTGV